MKQRLILATLIAATAFVPTVAQGQRPSPRVACVGSPQWATYPSTSPGCDVQAGQVLHVRYLPSTMTLSAAHTWCDDRGGDAVHTRYAGVANVCTNIDF